jgi:hypothetical protein
MNTPELPPLPRWSVFDQRLASLKYQQLALKFTKEIEAEDRRILHSYRHNVNGRAEVALRLDLRVRMAEEQVSRMYQIYCDVLQAQGFSKTGEFARMTFGTAILPFLSARTDGVIHEFETVNRRTEGLRGATERQFRAFRFEMQRLKDAWKRRLEIDAKEAEHLNRRQLSPLPASASSSGARPVVLKSWESVEITFLSEERVQISYSGTFETRNYGEFGFADRRNEVPSKAWEALKQLALAGGNIAEPKSPGQSWRNVEKRIQEIRSILRAQFKAPGDPIPFIRKVGYQTRFKIRCAKSYDG